MSFSNLKIRTKLWAAVGIIIVLLISLLGYTATRTARLTAEGAAVTGELAQRVDIATRWTSLTEANAARTLANGLSSEAVVHEVMQADIAKTSARISELQKDLESRALSSEDKAQMAAVGAARQAMLEARALAQKQRADGQADEAIKTVRGAYVGAVERYLTELRKFVAMQEAALKAAQVANTQARLTTVKISGAGAMAVLAIIVLGAGWLIRSISAPLGQATELARRIAGGDLTQRFAVKRKDEIGDLQRALLNMCDSLEHVVARVRVNTETMAVASREIAAGYRDLSERTDNTAGELGRAAANTKEFASHMGETGEAASEAAKLATHASGAAQRGGSAVTEVVATMNDISERSRKISEIIGVIDGIAFQTNILALNAAVEAARAGEQGRGFAVVASEVRALAGRSAQAAQEIKDLIVDSVARIESGTALVSNAGATMSDIVESVQKVTEMINRFTAITQAQARSVSVIDQAVGSVDHMTQQNATLVEQGAAAAANMREQAQELAQLVQVFQVRSNLPVLAQTAGSAPAMAATQKPAAPSASRAVAPLRAASGAVARAPLATIDPPAAIGHRPAAPRLAAPTGAGRPPQRPANDVLAAAVLPRHAPQYQQRREPPQLTHAVAPPAVRARPVPAHAPASPPGAGVRTAPVARPSTSSAAAATAGSARTATAAAPAQRPAAPRPPVAARAPAPVGGAAPRTAPSAAPAGAAALRSPAQRPAAPTPGARVAPAVSASGSAPLPRATPPRTAPSGSASAGAAAGAARAATASPARATPGTAARPAASVSSVAARPASAVRPTAR